MAPKSRRARTERRQGQRAVVKEVRAREKLAVAGPGGAADRPLVVSSASVIESKARDTRCVLCNGELQLHSHQAAPEQGAHLRVVKLVCRQCHAPRAIWFRIEARLPS